MPIAKSVSSPFSLSRFDAILGVTAARYGHTVAAAVQLRQGRDQPPARGERPGAGVLSSWAAPAQPRIAMAFAIDSSTYPKAATYPLRHGYQARGTTPSSIVVHSTEGPKGQSLGSAARYLYTSAAVSAHFLVGRAGELIQFLDPRKYQAWHAGAAIFAYANAHSIGIECLHASGEPWPQLQKDALAWLLSDLADTYRIPADLIDTHGQVALPGPYLRKHDPTNWDRPDFLVFVRAALAPPLAQLFRVTSDIGVNIRAEPRRAAEKIGALPKDVLFHGAIVLGELVAGVAQWVARLPSEGGGYAWLGACQEVV